MHQSVNVLLFKQTVDCPTLSGLDSLVRLDIIMMQVVKQECGFGWRGNNKRWSSGGLRQRQLRLFRQLSVVNDLQLIWSMYSACGNALHVVTA